MYPIRPRSVPAEPYAYWEDFFSPEELDKINALSQWLDTADARVGNGQEGGVVNQEIRRTDVAWLPLNSNTEWIYQRIANVVAEVNARFFRFDLDAMYEDIQLGVYHEKQQGYYNWHVDGGMGCGNPARKLSMALLLSDPSEFEGGSLQLKTVNDEPISVEQKKGRAWFFPAYTLHRVTPVTKGIRRSLVVWCGGKDFR